MDSYIVAHARALATRPAFRGLFKDLGESLVHGTVLDLEGLVDILTLKDNDGEAIGDPVIALDRLVRDTVSSLPIFDQYRSSLMIVDVTGRKEGSVISIDMEEDLHS